MKVLFVCLGNICRSPLAEAIFRDLVLREGHGEQIHVDSAGTAGYHSGETADPRSLQTAARHDLSITHRARAVRTEDFLDFDWIVAMDGSNLRDLRQLAGSEKARRKIVLMRDFDPSGPGDVPDPYYGGMDDFEWVWHLCERSSPRLLQAVLARKA